MKYGVKNKGGDGPENHVPENHVSGNDVQENQVPENQVPENQVPEGHTNIKHRHRSLKAPLVVLLVLLVVGVCSLVYLQRKFDPPGAAGPKMSITVPPRATTSQIASLLASKNVVSNAGLFRLYLRYAKNGPFQAGRYELLKNDSFSHAAHMLAKGPIVERDRLTIPEGFRIEQIAERVAKLPGRSADRFMRLAQGGTVKSKYQPAGTSNLEGLLFPDTYYFERTDDEAAILRRMVAEFDKRADILDINKSAAAHGRTPYEEVIIASLVEREAKLDSDRPKVASVITNRLAKGMALKIDATVLYAQGQGQQKTRVLNKDLQFASPYNTYLHPGLPPGPIASPGVKALEAALEPDATDYLYYVTVNDCTGETAFGRTSAEHSANVARRKRDNPKSC